MSKETKESPFESVMVERVVTVEEVRQLICNCLEGGYSNEWLLEMESLHLPGGDEAVEELKEAWRKHHSDWPAHFIVMTEPGGYVYFKVDDPNMPCSVHVPVGPEELRKGLQLFANSKEYGHHWRDFLNENDDAITGDVFMQFVIYGKVIYG